MDNQETKTETRLPDGRFAPGVSGNPEGRPKRKSFRDYFEEADEEALINRVKQAIADDPTILKMTVEQIFGKPRQPITGKDEDDAVRVVIEASAEGASKYNLNETPRSPGKDYLGQPAVSRN